ncbi:unnamed protein product [Adineta steineri]|uniref:Uncharacterized protein n=1 Tax=Adineta steineri TaxID=433720 RepID=A0A819ULS3_9BILA|nr:unnamed protein product [Adineta steineri]
MNDEDRNILTKGWSSSSASVSNNIVAPNATTVSAPVQQQQITSTTRTSATVSSHNVALNENDHRTFIINSITKWCSKKSSNLSSVEGDNYQVAIMLKDTDGTAKIKCGCGTSDVNIMYCHPIKEAQQP